MGSLVDIFACFEFGHLSVERGFIQWPTILSASCLDQCGQIGLGNMQTRQPDHVRFTIIDLNQKKKLSLVLGKETIVPIRCRVDFDGESDPSSWRDSSSWPARVFATSVAIDRCRAPERDRRVRWTCRLHLSMPVEEWSTISTSSKWDYWIDRVLAAAPPRSARLLRHRISSKPSSYHIELEYVSRYQQQYYQCTRHGSFHRWLRLETPTISRLEFFLPSERLSPDWGCNSINCSHISRADFV